MFDFGDRESISIDGNRCGFKTILKNRNTFKDFSNLQRLVLTAIGIAKIEFISFQHLGKLKILNLRYNQINEIDSSGFQGLDNLEEFYLDYNRLTKIESNSFRHLTKLRILNLANNQINEIDSNDFRWGGGLGQLEVFSFENNRLTRQAFLRHIRLWISILRFIWRRLHKVSLIERFLRQILSFFFGFRVR